MAGDEGGGGEGAEEDVPRDAKLVKSILRSMGVKQHEPRVVQQFLDFCYRYVVEVLGDAQLYSEHASKPSIDTEDVKLAIQSRVTFSFSQPPSRETLMELARVRNSMPLPKVISGPGIALPPEQDSLIAPNYQLVVPMKQADEMEVDDKDGNKPPLPTDKNGMSSPASQQGLEQDGSKKVSFSLAGKRPRS
ncbi:hypothetical protein GOP47_0003878 [Adiantum capillus-veneris]|uniref:Transcription initiation factor TFIID subunit 9 n=2 Tax=Adiantum capillus-veneris TaxID=13818 RepID=A0A9D4ZPU7_ADICA|nr:hypothetical protein GOP47_0003878 [Adiantum capillus-veneris]